MSGYDRWLRTLPEEVRADVKAKGLFNFLFGIPGRYEDQREIPKTSSLYGNAALQARVATGDPDALAVLDRIGDQAGAAATDYKYRLEGVGSNILDTLGVNGNPIQTALDVQSIASQPPEVADRLIDDLYTMSGVGEKYANIAKEFASLVNSADQNTMPVLVGVKNVMQNNSILPPDSKPQLIKQMTDAGVKPENAVEVANRIKKLNKKDANKVIEAIKNKIPEGTYPMFKPLINSIEAVV
jgi:hypothetical protein